MGTTDSKTLLSAFSAFIERVIGLHFPEDRWNELEKKLRPAVSAFECEDVPSCMTWLMNHPLSQEQIKVLAHHLTVGETYFFRDPKMFELLQTLVLPEILKRHESDRRLRIWSAGCCSGEELYSIAMLLDGLIRGIQDWNIQLLGTDINPVFLEKADKAQYKNWSFRTISPELVERYFKKNNDGTFSLNPEIQKMAKFSYLNLAENTYGLADMDLILCCNVLMYFSPDQIKKTIAQLAKALRPGGWLVVTPIEAPFISEVQLIPQYFKTATLFKKTDE